MNRRTDRAGHPSGIRPEVTCQLIREYVYLYGAVILKDRTGLYLIIPAPDTEYFLRFFTGSWRKKLSGTSSCLLRTQTAIIIATNSTSPPTSCCISFHLILAELNPQENLWDEIREKIFKNYALKSMDDIIA